MASFGDICLATLGRGLWLRFDFVYFCKWVSSVHFSLVSSMVICWRVYCRWGQSSSVVLALPGGGLGLPTMS